MPRKRKRKNKSKMPSFSTKQVDLLELLDKNDTMPAESFASRTINSMQKRGYCKRDGETVKLTFAGKKVAARRRRNTKNRIALEVEFFDAWQKWGDPSLGIIWQHEDTTGACNIFPDDRRHIDFVFPDLKIGIEVQGGVWLGNAGHSNGAGVNRDVRKMRDAYALGWQIFQFTTNDLVKKRRKATIELVLELIEARAIHAPSALIQNATQAYIDLVQVKLLIDNGNEVASIGKASPLYIRTVVELLQTWGVKHEYMDEALALSNRIDPDPDAVIKYIDRFNWE